MLSLSTCMPPRFILADYPPEMALYLFVVFGIVGVVVAAFALAFSKKPGDKKTAKLLLAIMGLDLLLCFAYGILHDVLRNM